MKQRVAILLVASTFVSGEFNAATNKHPKRPDKRVDQLKKERDKLTRAKDPVDRTKTQINISEILVSLMSDSVKSGDLEEMQKQLTEYCASIKDAHDTIMGTGRDANRHPGGFKDLEISLRR